MLALARRTFADGRTRTLAFAYLFGIYSYVQPAAYRAAYKTTASRLAFAHSFGPNTAVRMFYGEPRNLLTVTGYAAWRVAGTLAILASAWGLLAAVRAFRTEEDAGRAEVLLATAVSRRRLLHTSLMGIAAGGLLLWFAEFAGSLAGGLPAGGSAYMALATATILPVFVGVGTLASQLAPTRRGALALGGGVAVIAFTLRVAADTLDVAWLRWTTPLGWAENTRPFTGPQPLVLALPIVTTALLLGAAAWLAERRDVGSGLLPARDRAAPRLRLLRSPEAQALRSERDSLVTWSLFTFGFGIVVGTLSSSTGNGAISKPLQRQLAKLGAGSIATPAGYIALTLLFFIVAICLFACAQMGAARHEEEAQRLETLLALPTARLRWLGGRLLLAAAGILSLSLLSVAGAWLGTLAVGTALPLPKMLEAGANLLPTALLFLAIAALAYALAPRLAAAISYSLVIVAFLWQLVGAMLSVPHWLVDATPFAHIGLLPAAPAKLGAAALMIAIAAALLGVAAAAFRRRDLTGA